MSNPRTALFLGAGASVPYGKPTTKMLREELQDKLFSGSVLNGMLNSDVLPDIEHVLEAAYKILDHDKNEGGKYFNWLGHQNNMTLQGHSYDVFITGLKDSISELEELFFSRYKWNNETNQELINLGAFLDISFATRPHAYVFTTNYDAAVEKYCKNASIKTVDGFKNDEQLQCYRWYGFSRSDYELDGKRLYLYKLHGSLNWIKTDNGIERVSVERHNTATEKILIYPTLSAKSDVEKRPYREIWREFERNMRRVDVLTVIGYSFRDKRIADVIRKRTNSGMHLIVISPTCKQDCKNLFPSEFPSTLHLIDKELNQDNLKNICDVVNDVVGSTDAKFDYAMEG